MVAAFGEKILQEDGEVDRKKLGLIVFMDFVLRLPVIKHFSGKIISSSSYTLVNISKYHVLCD